MKDLIILGGGVAGLTAGYHAQRGGFSLLLLEKSGRWGGCLHSLRQNGFLMEKGPNSFLESQETIRRHIQDLKLEGEVIQAGAEAKNRFVLRGGKLLPFPKGPLEFFRTPLLTFRGKVRMLTEPWRRSHPACEEESVAQFVSRRLGVEALHLVEPMIRGVYAGEAAAVSLQGIAPRIARWEKEYGNLFRALKKLRLLSRGHGLFSFRDGMETLTDALHAAIGPNALAGCEVTEISRSEKNWKVRWKQGENTFEEIAPRLLLCLPAFEAANLLRETSAGLSKALAEIPYAPLALVHLAVERSSVSHPLNGFGFLTGRGEDSFLLGSLWSSSIFPGRSAEPSKTLFTCFAGGASNPSVLENSTEALIAKTLAQLQQIFGKKLKAAEAFVTRIPKALPQYTLGHPARIAAIREHLQGLKGLHIAGNFIDGISVNDTMENAAKAVEIIQAAKRR